MSGSISYSLIGTDGSTWPFVSLAECSLSTPLRLHSTPTGLGGAEFKTDDDQNVDQAGVTWRATMFEPNYIGLHILFGPIPPGPAALAKYLAFRDALGDSRQLGEFHVEGPRRTTVQRWRLAPPNLSEPDVDAVQYLGFSEDKGVRLRSDESWWRTAPIELTFSAAQFATAEIDNDSDDDTWPYYELTGPITTPKLGLGTEEITLPNIAAGQTWKIDTDPNFFHITDHLGVDRSFYGGVSLPGRWYVKAPAHTPNIPVKISGTGTTGATSLKVVLPQLFRAAV
ncbi:hypothetical protein [Antrihabitans spumae]|uniref:Minor tail protein n=1 Tax=Antrihabitans spumae TaxID=3373370 RepID=A0ABW7K9W3_9NOCA